MKKIGVLIFLFLVVACRNIDSDFEYYISLLENQIVIDSDGGKKRILISANCEWTILDTPNWCIVKKTIEDSKEYLDIDVLPNDTKNSRNTTLYLRFENISKSISILQSGKNATTSLPWYTFPMNTFTGVQIESNNTTQSYQITSEALFVNPRWKKQVFLGNLINTQIDNMMYLTDFYDKYTYNPISVTSNDGKIQKLLTPSFNEFNDFIEDIIAIIPKQNLKLSISSPIQYLSYKHLHLLGKGNIGFNLDEIVGGQPYYECEMKHRTGILYTYAQECFSVIMDYPQLLINESIKEPELSSIAYINSITFGKTGLLFIEGDSDFATISNVVTKIMKDEELNNYDIHIKDNLAIWLLSFDKNGEHFENGDFTLIRKYIKDQTAINSDQIIPLHFSVNKFNDHSLGALNIGVQLQ